ncbi:YdcF family protein [Nisaea nitritireducens]|uniref:YdcF family protein n=1 Tax=Nisaea nitritireducens TaxID=568392 RepID=UPI0018681C29|nr:YdcF family protein [Nisaea nitritireducens]
MSTESRQDGRNWKAGPLRGWLVGILSVAVVAGGLWVGGFFWFLAAMPSDAPRAAPEADAIVVLTGGSRRIPVAVSLLLEGHAKELLVTGVNDIVSPSEFRAAMAESGVAVDAETMACCVALGYGAHDTIGNAEEAAGWMDAGGYRSMILVTSNYHMARSRIEFRAAMPDIEISEYPVRPADPGLAEWWKSPQSRFLILSEYVKYQAAWLRVTLASMMPG